MIFFNVWKRLTQIKQYYIYKEYVEIIHIYNYFIYIVKIYFTCSFFISPSFKLFLENIILSIVFFFFFIINLCTFFGNFGFAIRATGRCVILFSSSSNRVVLFFFYRKGCLLVTFFSHQINIAHVFFLHRKVDYYLCLQNKATISALLYSIGPYFSIFNFDITL